MTTARKSALSKAPQPAATTVKTAPAKPRTKGGKALLALEGVLKDAIREQKIKYPD